MKTNTEINPFVSEKNAQKSFYQAMNTLVSRYKSPQSFTETAYLLNEVTVTFSHHFVITTKDKDDHLQQNDRPIYVGFFNPPHPNEVPVGKGSFGELYRVELLLKYPPKREHTRGKKDILKPVKIKYPSNLLIKLSKFYESESKTKFNYDFFLKEYTFGKKFIKMPYLPPKNKDCFMLLMENIQGITLQELINRLTTNPNLITAKSYLHIVVNLLSALTKIQNKNIIHCDITPNNILITQNLDIIIVDFGLATDRDNVHQEILGSRIYREPQATVNSFKSDLFSMMLVILELLGQTNRNYLQTVGELNDDNRHILVNEVLLGVEEVSSKERRDIKEILKLAVAFKPDKRLDDLQELMKFFQYTYDNHTASSLSFIEVPNKSFRQDIIDAQDINWFSPKSLNAVNKPLWCSTALKLYSQTKTVPTNSSNDPFLQAFINHQLPRHIYWQDSTVSTYCENMAIIDAQINIIKQFIAHSAFKNTSLITYLNKTLKTRPNDATVLIKIAETCEKALRLYHELSLIDNAADYPEIKKLITFKQLELLNTFCVETFSGAVDRINGLTLKLKGYQDFQAHLNNISRLKKYNQKCFTVMKNELISSFSTFMNDEQTSLTFPDDIKYILSTLALMMNGFVTLHDFKKHYGLRNEVYFNYLSPLINTLMTLKLQNDLEPIRKGIQPLQAIADSLSALTNLKSNRYIATPTFITWVDNQLSKIFAKDLNTPNIESTGERLKRCAQQLSKYITLDEKANDIDKNAFSLLNIHMQFIFKENNLIDINNALFSLNGCKLKLIKLTIDLMRLKKLLSYAGRLDTINTTFEQALMQCAKNSDTGLESVKQVLNNAKDIAELFSKQDAPSTRFNSIIGGLPSPTIKRSASRVNIYNSRYSGSADSSSSNEQKNQLQ